MVSALCVFGFHEQCLDYIKMYKYEKFIAFENLEELDKKNNKLYKERNKNYEVQIKNFFNI